MAAARDTICALSSASGRAGVAVVRLSGDDALGIASQLGIPEDVAPRQAHYLSLINPENNTLIDTAIVLFFPHPNSFTGENVFEFQVHGSQAVVEELISVLVSCGARPALPGEFTQRAFDNNKMGLLEVESLSDLLEAETIQQKEIALQGVNGWQRKHIAAVRDALVHAMAMLEAYIDFPEEEIPASALIELDEARTTAMIELERWLGQLNTVDAIRNGIRIAIVGAPNAGKSTLLNRLAKRDVAIVSPAPGTTRDILEVRTNIKGHLVLFQDTAGLHEGTGNAIEAEGMERAKAAIDSAHLLLHIVDASAESPDSRLDNVEDKDLLRVYNKADKVSRELDGLVVSALNGDGIDDLVSEVSSWCERVFSLEESPVIVRLRQRAHIEEALSSLGKDAVSLPLEIRAELLRQAAASMSSVLGDVVADDLLEKIFSSFCIGK